MGLEYTALVGSLVRDVDPSTPGYHHFCLHATVELGKIYQTALFEVISAAEPSNGTLFWYPPCSPPATNEVSLDHHKESPQVLTRRQVLWGLRAVPMRYPGLRVLRAVLKARPSPYILFFKH